MKFEGAAEPALPGRSRSAPRGQGALAKHCLRGQRPGAVGQL